MAASFSPVKLSCRCEINLTMVVLSPSRGNELRNELITLERERGGGGAATWEPGKAGTTHRQEKHYVESRMKGV